MKEIKQICIVPHSRGVGGPASFRLRFSRGAAERDIRVTDDLDDPATDAVLVISSWRQLGKLWRLKRQGVRIVQRLGVIHWLHKRTRFNLRYYLKAEYGNWLMNYTRKRLADRIIFQSEFVAKLWQDVYGAVAVPQTIVHNGVDLEAFSPQGPGALPKDTCRIMIVEGTFGGGYDIGLKLALDLANQLAKMISQKVELVVAGRAAQEVQAYWNEYADVPIVWKGVLPREEIPGLDRSAHMLFSADLNAACPNSVIEALACGLPVIGYATGSLPELVGEDAGQVVPFAGDPWRLELPDTSQLAEGALAVFRDQGKFRSAARARAEAMFDIEDVVARYLEVLSSS